MLRCENIQTTVALGTIIFELRTLFNICELFCENSLRFTENSLRLVYGYCCQGPKYASVLTETCSIATFAWLDEQ